MVVVGARLVVFLSCQICSVPAIYLLLVYCNKRTNLQYIPGLELEMGVDATILVVINVVAVVVVRRGHIWTRRDGGGGVGGGGRPLVGSGSLWHHHFMC